MKRKAKVLRRRYQWRPGVSNGGRGPRYCPETRNEPVMARRTRRRENNNDKDALRQQACSGAGCFIARSFWLDQRLMIILPCRLTASFLPASRASGQSCYEPETTCFYAAITIWAGCDRPAFNGLSLRDDERPAAVW